MTPRLELPPALADLRIVRAGFAGGCLTADLEDGRRVLVVSLHGRVEWEFVPAVAHA